MTKITAIQTRAIDQAIGDHMIRNTIMAHGGYHKAPSTANETTLSGAGLCHFFRTAIQQPNPGS